MWGLVFRNPGFFGGSGKSSPLTSIEADTNTEILANQIVAKQAQGDSVVDVVQSGNQFYFLLSNHSYIGPVTLPSLSLNPRGAWTALTAYAVNDLVTVGTKVYLVIFAHTSGSTFDPYANDGSGHNYYSLFLDIGSAASPTVQTKTGSTYTLALTDAFTYNRFVNAAGCMVTVPSNSSVPFPVGAEIWLYQAAAGFVTVVESFPVVVNPITGYSNETKCEGAAIKLKKVATDAWDISGLLEPISGH
jgi:hypothetical protein